MFSSRSKKLAIAAAILLVGGGTALMLRREEAPSDLTGRTSTMPSVVPKPKIRSITTQPEQTAKLAGRIEPYVSSTVDSDIGDTGQPTVAAPGLANNAAPASPVTAAPSVQRSEFYAEAAVDPVATGTGPAPRSGEPPLKWHNVRRGNSGVSAAASQRNGNSDNLVPGQTLLDRPVDKRHTIADGDTLAALAHRYLGSAQRRLDIFEYNRDVLASPELLPIGTELRIPLSNLSPPADPPANAKSNGLVAITGPLTESTGVSKSGEVLAGKHVSAPAAGAQTYVVQPHDTLPLIARKLFGDISRQGELMAANRQQLRSPKDLRPGMTLVVPAPGARPR